jgi:hypothetical protein
LMMAPAARAALTAMLSMGFRAWDMGSLAEWAARKARDGRGGGGRKERRPGVPAAESRF